MNCPTFSCVKAAVITAKALFPRCTAATAGKPKVRPSCCSSAGWLPPSAHAYLDRHGSYVRTRVRPQHKMFYLGAPTTHMYITTRSIIRTGDSDDLQRVTMTHVNSRRFLEATAEKVSR